MKSLLNIDRRVIFIFVFVAAVASLIVRFELPITVSEPVKKIFDKVDSLNDGDSLMIAFDYDPSAKEELHPMAIALLHHAFSRGVKILGLTLWPGGTGLAEDAIISVAGEYNKKSGQDYVFLGYKPGQASLIINMGEDLYTAFPKDYYGNDISSLPALDGIRSLRDIDYVIDLAAGTSIETWIAYGTEKYKFDFGAGCTAVIGPDMYPFLQSGQINGLMGGLKGAAEYEVLVNKRGAAVRGMKPQGVLHLLVVMFVIFGNVLYFAYGKRTEVRKAV